MKRSLIILDDRHQDFAMYKSQCGRCKHLDSIELSCKAFPKGVPMALLSGKISHDLVLPNQIGQSVFTRRL